jgi:uncharacterized protein
MTVAHALVVLAAGAVAGAMNAVVGGGTLVSFPALLAIGLPPVTANVSNSLGVLPGSVSGAYAYRHQLAPLRAFLVRTAVPAALGGLTGAGLLLVLPARVFAAAVPVLLLLTGAVVAAQPWLTRRLAHRADAAPADRAEPGAVAPRSGGRTLVLVFFVAVYGGYFGAGVSVMFLAVLGVVLGGIQAANGSKNVMSAVSGLAAAVVFVARAPVDWGAVLLLAVGSTAGGLLAGRYGRRLPDRWLRVAVIVLAVAVAVRQAVS